MGALPQGTESRHRVSGYDPDDINEDDTFDDDDDNQEAFDENWAPAEPAAPR